MLSIAVICDLKSWRIPNWLAGVGVLTGVFVSVASLGLVEGIKSSLWGLCFPFFLLYILFYFRLFGAGDIKLLCAVGAFVGTEIGYVLLYTFILGGAISVLYLVARCVTSSVNHRQSPIISLSKQGACTNMNLATQVLAGKRTFAFTKMHFSLAILAGYVVYLLKI